MTAEGLVVQAITNVKIATLMKINKSHRKFGKDKKQRTTKTLENYPHFGKGKDVFTLSLLHTNFTF